ncbi:MAG TPA: hypothetical protein PKX00_13035 [Opitutaceae bacterium]|nr:hypothetical protein [Opitutaceae bacterium]
MARPSGKNSVTLTLTPAEADNLAELLRGVITMNLTGGELAADDDSTESVLTAWSNAHESRRHISPEELCDCEVAAAILGRLGGAS